MDDIKENRVEYFILFVAILVFMFLVYRFRFNKEMLILLSGVGSALYVIWGVVHHLIRGKLTTNIAYEYILFGLLVFLLFFTVLSF